VRRVSASYYYDRSEASPPGRKAMAFVDIEYERLPQLVKDNLTAD
jgi:hypothetical protein